MPPDHTGFLRRAHRFLVYFGGIYACFLVLLTVPEFQRHLIFMHKVRWPLHADFTQPEKYGLAPQKVVNLNITTQDNVRLGAWFITADSFYTSSYVSAASPNFSSLTFSSDSISSAMRLYPTVLYFHGNAGTRAVAFRIATYASYTTRLGANLLAIDYRGFGDSEGSPTEEGVQQDARAAWQWLVDHGARPEDIVLVGQSLGTGVAAQLAQELASKNTRPRGLVLVAPFSSLHSLLHVYNLGGWIPVLKPLQSIPFAQGFLLRFLRTKFDTKAALPNVKTDIVLIHSEDDFDIPLAQSTDLFDTLLEPLMPPSPLTKEEMKQLGSITSQRWSEIRAGEVLRRQAKERVVRTNEVEGFGRIHQFNRTKDGPLVVFVESMWGGHDHVGRLEGVVDVVGDVLNIKRAC